MTPEEIVEILESHGFTVEAQKRLGNDKGTQLRTVPEGFVNIFDNGTIQYQGKYKADLKKAVEGKEKTSATHSNQYQNVQHGSESKKIFVVYGHDIQAREDLELLLLKWNLQPVILDQLPSKGQTVIEKLESYMKEEGVGYGVVLATPDDEGKKIGGQQLRPRARQNVVLELGMLLTQLGRHRVAIFLKETDPPMEHPSDIAGLVYLSFKETIKEQQVRLANELGQALGITITAAQMQT